MTQRALFDKTELYLIRVLFTVITERSVSRAAMRLATTQPAVSAQLKRLRALVGDPLLVRSGTGMAPTEVALQLLPVAEALLTSAQTLFGGKAAALAFTPKASELEFRIAASDYLDPLFLPALVERLKTEAPQARLTIHALSAEFDYRARLARGEVDLVIGNWLEPPGELHLGRLFSDDIVCLVAADHPAVRNPRGWTQDTYLDADHVAPTPLAAGTPGVIDDHLAQSGHQRRITVRCPHFALTPLMVARSHLVLTTGRQFCSRYLDSLPVRIVRCPMGFPALTYYQLWHELSHNAASLRWLREQVREVARALAAAHRAA
jgi:DNA-binding transcriptional LysR family regulator